MIIARQQANQDAIMDIGGWLRSLGLERYEAAFRENAIEADLMHDLTDQDLFGFKAANNAPSAPQASTE